LRKKFFCGGAVDRRELKMSFRIAGQDELHGAAAEVAMTVE
jgi:hypothetical protein